jgi:hypothetical protein
MALLTTLSLCEVSLKQRYHSIAVRCGRIGGFVGETSFAGVSGGAAIARSDASSASSGMTALLTPYAALT